MSLYESSKPRLPSTRRGILDPALEDLIRRVEAIDPTFASTLRDNTVETKLVPVSFWKRHALRNIEVSTLSRKLSRVFAESDSGLRVVSRSEAIYAINRDENLHLEGELVGEYIRFFIAQTGMLRGARIVETVDDLRDVGPATKRVEAMVAPLASTRDGGHHQVVMFVIRGKELVEQRISMTSSGVVEAVTSVVLMDGL